MASKKTDQMSNHALIDSGDLCRFSLYDRPGRGITKNEGQCPHDRMQQATLAASRTTELRTMSADADAEKSKRFREAALPHLDDVFTLARYLMRDKADAEDATQECYLRALQHFDGYRGPAMKPWLLTILRNVCNSEFARRAAHPLPSETGMDEHADDEPLWQRPQPSPEAQLLQRRDSETIRRLIADLPPTFREAIVLRDINDLSYRDIAAIAGVPVGTVMSRLARARSLLRAAWSAKEGLAT
jgi:RNA polymerase sigma-70 factor, ECF subfamily